MKKIIQNAALAILSIIISLVVVFTALEIVLRIYTKPDVTPGYVRTHSSRRYELRPYFHGRTYSADFSVNSLGLRDYERPVSASAYRIAVFGDSITFGIGVRTEETFPKIAEARLNEYFNGKKEIQVFNFGIPSYNTVQEYYYIRESYDRFKPDMIIVEFSAQNDTKKMPSAGPDTKIIMLIKDMLRGLYSYNYLAEKIYRLKYKIDARNYADSYQERFYYDNIQYRDGYEGWQEAKEAFRGIRDFCRDHDIALVFAIVANTFKVAPVPEEDILYPIVKKVREALRAAGVEHIIVLDDAVRGYAGRESLLWVSAKDGHFSKLAHELVADYLSRYICDNMEIQK